LKRETSLDVGEVMRQDGSARGGRPMVVGVAWFRAADWARLLEISEDRDKLEDSHSKWLEQANRALRGLEKGGLKARRVVIDLDELVQWSAAQKLPINSEARSKFVAQKVRQEEARGVQP
jgi:hypothetical protein